VANGLVATALALAVVMSAWFAFHPTVNQKTGPLVPAENGTVVRKLDKKTFIDANGPGVILVLLFPIALCGYALFARTTAAATAAGAGIVAFSLILTLFFWTDAAYYLICAALLLIPAGLVETGVIEGEYD
jgi:hypothetical protein